MSFALGSGKREGDWLQYLITIVAVFFTFIATSILSAVLIYKWTDNGQNDLSNWIVFAIQLLPFVTGLIVLKICVEVLHKRRFLSVITSRNSIDFKRFFFATGLWLLVLTVFLVMAKSAGAPVVLRWNPEEQLPLLAVCLVLLPIQTAFEDIMYRGYLFQGLARSTGVVWLALLILALLFGWMHAGNPEVKMFGYWVLPYYILSGLFMGTLAHLDDGLELGMGYHFANNFFGAMIVTNNWQVFQTDALYLDNSEPYFGWENYLTILVVQPVLLYLFYKIYRWKNPVKKLTQ